MLPENSKLLISMSHELRLYHWALELARHLPLNPCLISKEQQLLNGPKKTVKLNKIQGKQKSIH